MSVGSVIVDGDSRGRDGVRGGAPHTVLRELLRKRHLLPYRLFCQEYEKVAGTVDKRLVGTFPAETTYKRWLSGRIAGLPRSEPCIVLEAMFPDHTVEQLFSPAPPSEPSDSEGSTVLRELLRRRYLHTYRAFCDAYSKAAATIDKNLAHGYPAERQFYRWITGDLLGLPYPHHCAVLEAMFPGYTAQQLFEPYRDDPPDGGASLANNNNEVAFGHSWQSLAKTDDQATVAAQVATNFSLSALDAFARASLPMDPSDFLDQVSIETPAPGRIGWSDVEHIRSTTCAVATAENVFGGGLSCEAALGQLRWAGKLLNARADNDVRRAMLEAVGNLSSVVAYSAFDISAFDAADHCFYFALWCSDQSGSWALRANTLAEMSRKAAYLGDLDDALSMIEFAQVRSDRLTSTARAMLCTLRARLLALTSRYAEASSDIARADAYFHDGAGEQNPPWLTYYDMAEHQGSIGKALIPIAMTERNVDVAAPRLRDAIQLHRENYPRSRAFSRTRLATLAMDVGDPHEAVTIGRQLLGEVAPLRSDRIVSELRGLARVSNRYSQIGDVNDLRHDILTLAPPDA